MLNHNSENAWELLYGLENKNLEKESEDGESLNWGWIMKLETS